MRKKRLLIVRVSNILDKNKIYKHLVKQAKKNVITIDKSYDVSYLDYNNRELEIKVIHKNEDLGAEKKGDK